MTNDERFYVYSGISVALFGSAAGIGGGWLSVLPIVFGFAFFTAAAFTLIRGDKK